MPSPSEIKRFETAVAAHPTWPRAMCIGDSWFQYPPHPVDLTHQLRAIYSKTVFWNDSQAGRESAKLKRALPRVRDALGAYQFDALLVSMGGNDVVGTELAEFVKSAADPQDFGDTDWGVLPSPVRDHIRLATFERALAYLITDYQQIIQLRDRQAPRCEIVVHTYDYPWPDGKPFKLLGLKAGPWLKPYLNAVGMSAARDQRATAIWLIDQFARVLAELVARTPRMRMVDARGTLGTKRQWSNEIHPTRAGFKKLALDGWKPMLDGLLA